MFRSEKSGFTLIELLVVIAIIAVLAAILFPVFTEARKAGQKTACMSNCRQWGMALMQYVDNNNNTWPDSCICGTQRGINLDGDDEPTKKFINSEFCNLLAPYAKNKGFRYCPSDPGRSKPETDQDGNKLNVSYSYVYRWTINYFAVGNGPLKSSDFARPSRQYVIHEKSDFHGKRLGFYGPKKGLRVFFVVFADGHAVFYTKPIDRGFDPNWFMVRYSPEGGCNPRYDYDL